MTGEPVDAAVLTALKELVTATATAQKTIAEAEKARADADSVRAATEDTRRKAQTAADAAAEDLETKRLGNEKTRDELGNARIDKAVAQYSAAIPNIAALPKNTVTFNEGKVLRNGELVARALQQATQDVAEAVSRKLEGKSDPKVFVTAETRLLTAVANHRQLCNEAKQLTQHLKTTTDKATDEIGTTGVKSRFGVPGADRVVAGVVGAALTQAAALLEVDVAVTTSDSELPADTVHAAVIHELLGKAPGLTVRHQWLQVPAFPSPPAAGEGGEAGAGTLMAALDSLIDADLAAAEAAAALDVAIDDLGDPAADLAKAQKSGDETGALSAQGRQDKLSKLKLIKAKLGADVGKAKAFVDRINTASSTTGQSPLSTAASIEPIFEPAGWHVLIVGDGKAESVQVLVKRRLLAPRLQTTTTVGLDFYLLKEGNVVAAGHKYSSSAYRTTITKEDGLWTAMPL